MEASTGNWGRNASNCSTEESAEELRLQSPKLNVLPQYSLDIGTPKSLGLDNRFDSMNALDILRETIRILRLNSLGFMAIAATLICPVSAVLLSNILVDQSLVKTLSFRLLLVAQSIGIPSSSFLKQSCQRLSEMAVSSIFCFPLFITFSLLAKAAIVHSVACTYAGKKVVLSKFIAVVVKIWRRLLTTYLWICMMILGCVTFFIVLLVTVCNMFVILGSPSNLVAYPALALAVTFAVLFTNMIIICNLATVISVLEDTSGPQALLRSVFLIKGQIQVGLLIFLGSTIGLAFVEALFEHRVKTLSYGDGSSRIWEGPLLVIMYSFVVLIDAMMSAVFYFTCRSSSMGTVDEDGRALIESQPSFSRSTIVH